MRYRLAILALASSVTSASAGDFKTPAEMFAQPYKACMKAAPHLVLKGYDPKKFIGLLITHCREQHGQALYLFYHAKYGERRAETFANRDIAAVNMEYWCELVFPKGDRDAKAREMCESAGY